MRSKLFVPGGRPELFAKALAGDADALSFDLEDSVADNRKAIARQAVGSFLASEAALQSAKLLIVRTNPVASPYFGDDLAAIVGAGIALINLPKVESATEILVAVEVLQRVEAAHGLDRPISLLVNIETPRGLLRADQIAGAHPRVAGLQLGMADMFEPHGIDRRDPANVHAAMFAVRMAAAQAGLFALDGARADIDDTEGFSEEARMARRLGYLGKSCVHPRQVPLANAAFAVSEEDIAAARRIVEAAKTASEQGLGAFMVDGKMIDLPFLKRAQALLAAHER
ncbi:MAG TPA: CoA ester lyase [Luteibacter sp.]|nr:CoA ester lyase [Luteibacter sp.]